MNSCLDASIQDRLASKDRKFAKWVEVTLGRILLHPKRSSRDRFGSKDERDSASKKEEET